MNHARIGTSQTPSDKGESCQKKGTSATEPETYHRIENEKSRWCFIYWDRNGRRTGRPDRGGEFIPGRRGFAIGAAALWGRRGLLMKGERNKNHFD